MANTETPIIDRYYSGSQNLSNINLRNLVKGNENYLGSGAFGDVYYVRDGEGNKNIEYAVKILRRNFISIIHDAINKFLQKNFIDKIAKNPSGRLATVDYFFAAEVKALEKLKGQGIGPELVYANFTNYYYIVERMDRTLQDMLATDSLSRDQILKLLALSDRYIRSEYLHNDLHENNIMWSDKLNDFRIIDWGISLFINPTLQHQLHQEKLDNLFHSDLIYVIMIYTMNKIQLGDLSEKEKWIVIQEKFSGFISRYFPNKVDEYDIFSTKYKYKNQLKHSILKLQKLQIKSRPHNAVTFLDKIRREYYAMTGKKGGNKKTRRKRRKRRKRNKKTRRQRNKNLK